jgi:hypothetical protein
MTPPLPNGRGTVSGCHQYRTRQQAAIVESNFFKGFRRSTWSKKQEQDSGNVMRDSLVLASLHECHLDLECRILGF